jgi:hypothetical protein
MYRQAMQRIKEEHRELAYRVLSWILHAYQPLTIVELQHALAFDGETAEIDPDILDDDVFVLSVCCGLITSRRYGPSSGDEDHTVVELGFVREFVFHLGPHSNPVVPDYTAHEHLLRNAKIYTELMPAGRVAMRCLEYISSTITSSPPSGEPVPFSEMRIRYPLYSHALESMPGFHQTLDTNARNVGSILCAILRDRCRRLHLQTVMYGATGCALHLASFFGWEPIVRIILQDLRTKPYDPEEHESSRTVSLDSKEHACINSGNEMGQTPLLLACKFGRDNVVGLLLGIECTDVNSSNDEGRTPLFYAAKIGHLGIVQALLQRPELVLDARDRTGATPLAIAVEYGHISVVKWLLQTKKVDVNSRDRQGITPIMTCAIAGHQHEPLHVLEVRCAIPL